jgi:hypothetical protein
MAMASHLGYHIDVACSLVVTNSIKVDLARALQCNMKFEEDIRDLNG